MTLSVYCVFQSWDCISDRQVLVSNNVQCNHAAAEADFVLNELLYKLENGVEIALHRAQLWSKFAKDLINFIDKRTNICEFLQFLVFTATCSIKSNWFAIV